MVSFRTNKKTGGKFVPKPKKGKRMSQSFGLGKNDHLTMAQIEKILQERNIEPNDLIFESDSVGQSFEGRKISLHPSNELIDNVVVKVDSPHVYDEVDLIQDPKLNEKQEHKVRVAKGLPEPEEEVEEKTEENK